MSIERDVRAAEEDSRERRAGNYEGDGAPGPSGWAGAASPESGSSPRGAAERRRLHHGRASAGSRRPQVDGRVARSPVSLRARADRLPDRLHAHLLPHRDRLEPVPGLDSARCRADSREPPEDGRPRARLRRGGGDLADLPAERALHDHRPEVRRLQRRRPRALRRPAPRGGRVDRARPRPRVASPHPRDRAALDRLDQSLAARRRRPRAVLLRDLPRTRSALELVGRLRPARRAGPRRVRRGASSPPACADDPLHVLPGCDLPRLVFLCNAAAVVLRAAAAARGRRAEREHDAASPAHVRDHARRARRSADVSVAAAPRRSQPIRRHRCGARTRAVGGRSSRRRSAVRAAQTRQARHRTGPRRSSGSSS